jgi:LTXXQ motif family protein
MPMPQLPTPARRIARPQITTPHIVAPRVANPNVVAPYVAPPGRAVVSPNVAPTYTIGPGPATRNRDVAGSSQSLIQSRSGGPILRNPAYATISARDPASRALAQSTFGGRFVHSGFVSEDGRHRHHLGRVIAFVGPVFWPFAYDDFIDYTFSPYAYDTFWPYAYDDVFDGIYGAYAPNYSDYAPNSDYPAGGTAYVYGNETGAWVAPEGRSMRAATRMEGATQICSGQTEGFTNFPIQRIAQQVKPNQDQQALLDELKAATAEALDILRAACPSDLPGTPTGRLAAVRSRVEAMLQAVRVIDPALQKFYRSLNDEQKERLNALDAENLASAENRQPDPTQLCGGEAQAASLPITMIEQVLRLSDVQRANLDALKEASVKAGDILKANCPNEPTLTPPARLDHMEQRLAAMMQVLDTVQPALVNFYGSLDDEQKARFNRIGVRAP